MMVWRAKGDVVHIHNVDNSPINERGGQKSYLLLARGQFGSTNLAITWVECPAGSEQAVHEHPDAEQVYVIVRGRGVMQVGDDTREVDEGSLVFVPPGAGHAIKNASGEPLVFVSATSPPFDADALSEYFRYGRP
jgi:mannose-6-phosphate isomerase-like protein (cupin superfamily)